MRVLLSRNFANVKCRENKTLAKMAKSLCRLLMQVNHILVTIFNVTHMSLKTFCENKILAKISEFTECDEGAGLVAMLYKYCQQITHMPTLLNEKVISLVIVFELYKQYRPHLEKPYFSSLQPGKVQTCLLNYIG